MEPELGEDLPWKVNMEIFHEIHKDLPRQGPGNNEFTRKALSYIKDLPKDPDILDIGCGSGMQTLELARAAGGHIIALDNHQPFLDQLAAGVKQEKLSDRITAVNGSMFEMKFRDASFDLVWSEGAIYIMGFEKGLIESKRMLKSPGFVAVSNIFWVKENMPKDLYDFWMENFPDIKTREEELAMIERVGYRTLGHFTLPDSVWWESYYNPIAKKLPELEKLHKDEPGWMETINMEKSEMEMFRKHSGFYGYEFYIMKK